MDGNKNLFQEKIMDAEMILIGIGEEFQDDKSLPESTWSNDELYQLAEKEQKLSWMLPYMRSIQEKNAEVSSSIQAYKVLYDLIKEKNYFVVTTRTDDIIWNSEFDREKIVAPCGGHGRMQCEQGCEGSLREADPTFEKKIEACMKGKEDPYKLSPPVCAVCGAGLVYNNIEAKAYIEEGYLGQWAHYKSWLQGTVNRKVCIIELGAGMKYPTVIRWPFEKIAFFNQKAVFFRVNSKLYHLSQELNERAYKIKEKPIDFLINGFVLNTDM